MKRKSPPHGVTRREVLQLAVGVPLAALGAPVLRAQETKAGALTLEMIQQSPARVVFVTPGVDRIRVRRTWDGPLCKTVVHNSGRETMRLKEIVLFEVEHTLPPATRLYGEGFQMLSQTGGTLGAPRALGHYTDAKHYRLPQPAQRSQRDRAQGGTPEFTSGVPEDATVVYGALTLSAPEGPHSLLAFTSCRRFSGQFHVKPSSFQVVVDMEGLEIAYGEDVVLEEFSFRSGADRDALLAETAARINVNHPPLRVAAPPSGWCSWYCFGPTVTAKQVLDNLGFIAKNVPGLRYVQVDDGYQPAMGDWLLTGTAFGGNVQGVLKQIRAKGFEPALWVAPFVAEKGSKLFQEHPEWFVRDAEGQPLSSDKVSFGGWGRGPWFVLDGTHPEAQKHLTTVFRTMKDEWGCTYFKLDANPQSPQPQPGASFWGAIHGGRFHDPKATRIEAYRRGMEAIRAGTGSAFLLGCNHPLWASLGLLHGSRSSNDIKRTWDRVSATARENLLRSWQNGRLWWNDPDAVVLTGLTEEELRFHATAIYASGGMILSGDDLTKLPKPQLEMLKKLLPPTGVAARFAEDDLQVGTMEMPGRQVIALLNWSDAPQTLSAPVPAGSRVRELWTGEDLGLSTARTISRVLPPRSGRLLVCTAAGFSG
jgi:alpha-galactosidase